MSKFLVVSAYAEVLEFRRVCGGIVVFVYDETHPLGRLLNLPQSGVPGLLYATEQVAAHEFEA